MCPPGWSGRLVVYLLPRCMNERPTRGGHSTRPHPGRAERPIADKGPPPPRGKRSRRGGKSGAPPRPHLTSLPTTRNAYLETREWLLKQHGPVCAYCARRVPAEEITLDHVTPRRGQTAYDRRDNLVLACQRCNGLKADTPILAFLLGNRARAKNLVRFGEHLSPGLLDLARSLLPEGFEFEEDSPYKD